MAIFPSFNPKTLYISTFSHVAASSTSTPSSPSQSWPSGWHTHWQRGGGEKKRGGDPQVDLPSPLPHIPPSPPPLQVHTQMHAHTRTHAHSHTNKHTLDYGVFFRHKSESVRRRQEEEEEAGRGCKKKKWRRDGDAVEMQKSGTGCRKQSDGELN